MSCGCIVIGNHGNGGREFMRPEYCYPIPQGDIMGFARTVEDVITEYNRQPERLRRMARKGSEFIRAEYCQNVVERELREFWAEMADCGQMEI
jgi:hypothetical protein